MNLKTIALVTALSLGATAGVAYAEQSGIDALSGASTLSFQTVNEAEAPAVMAGTGLASDQVDIDSLKARIEGNPTFLAQLEAYGATIDDVVGINATSETDVTILVRG